MVEKPTAIQKAEEIEKSLVPFLKIGADLVVSNEEEEVAATEFLGGCKSRWKRIEEVREEWVKPLNETVKKLNNLFKSQQVPLKEAEDKIKNLLSAYHQVKMKEAAALKKKEEDAAAAAAKVAEKKGEEVAPVPIMSAPAKTNVKTKHGTAIYKTVWKFEIEDGKKVPAEYLVVDETKIREAVAAGVREIKGVKIFQKTETSIRS